MTDPRAPSPELETIQPKLANGALDEAGTLIDKLLVEFASDPNLAYLSALRYRLSGNAPKALQTLTDLTTRFPDMARAHQEMALNCLSINLPQKALEAAEAAVALDGSLLASWELLAPLHQRFAPEKKGITEQQIAFLKSLPQELRTVMSNLSQTQLTDAER